MSSYSRIEHGRFERMPERLALNAYRYALHPGSGFSSPLCKRALTDHCRCLGPELGRNSLASMGTLVAAIGRCSGCPLRCSHPSSRSVCREECLLIGLISGIQHGDDETSFMSALALAGFEDIAEIMAAGGGYAIALKHASHILLPVPAEAVREIVNHASHETAIKRKLN